MRFMILVRASPMSEAGPMPSEEQIAEQLAFHQAIEEAGVLIDAMGFHPRRTLGGSCGGPTDPER